MERVMRRYSCSSKRGTANVVLTLIQQSTRADKLNLRLKHVLGEAFAFENVIIVQVETK